MKTLDKNVARLIVGYKDTGNELDAVADRFGLGQIYFDPKAPLSPALRVDLEKWLLRNGGFEGQTRADVLDAKTYHYRLNWDTDNEVLRCDCGYTIPITSTAAADRLDLSKPCPQCGVSALFVR